MILEANDRMQECSEVEFILQALQGDIEMIFEVKNNGDNQP